jgi:hypothetical protein
MKMNIVVKNERVHWKYDGWGDASEGLLVTNDDFQTASRELYSADRANRSSIGQGHDLTATIRYHEWKEFACVRLCISFNA